MLSEKEPLKEFQFPISHFEKLTQLYKTSSHVLRVFHHLRDFLASNGESVIFKEEFYVKRLHRLLADFIVLMPLKV